MASRYASLTHPIFFNEIPLLRAIVLHPCMIMVDSQVCFEEYCRSRPKSARLKWLFVQAYVGFCSSMKFKSLFHSAAKITQNLPLRAILIVPFVLQIVGAVGLVGYVSFRNSRSAVNDLATQLRDELSARIEQELQAYFDLPHDINQLNTIAFIRDELDLTTGAEASQFLRQLRISPFIYAVYCGDSQGQFLGAFRLRDKNDSLGIWNANALTEGNQYNYRTDNLGNRSFLFRDAGPYDPRLRPWYKASVREERPIWSDVYLAFSSQLPAITASQPIYNDAGNEVVGVCATDVLLTDDLREFLQSLRIGKSGHAFVMDRSGVLLSSSTNDPIMVGEGRAATLLEAVESQDTLVRETARYLFNYFGENLQDLEASPQVDFVLEGNRQLVQVVPFKDNYGLDLLIILVLPESDFMEQIHANNAWAIGFCLLALGLATVIGIWTSQWITKPLIRLGQASQNLARSRSEQHVEVSRIKELQILAQSFNQMSHQLQFFFNALDKSNQKLAKANEELEQRVEERTAELTESQRVLTTLMSNLPGMAYRLIHDGVWVLEFASEGCYGLTGYRPEELLGKQPPGYEQLIDPDDLSMLIHEIYLAIQESRPFKAIYRLITATGEQKWVWDQGRGVFDSSNKLLGLEGFLTDITDRQQARMALEQKSARDNLLSQISQQLINEDFDRAMAFALEAVGQVTASDRCYVVYLDAVENQFSTSHEWCASCSESETNLFRTLAAGTLPWLYTQYKLGNTVKIGNLNALPGEATLEMAVMKQHSIQALLMVPMLYREKVVGCMGLDMVQQPRSWSDDDVQLLQLVGEMLAMGQTRYEAEQALRLEQEKSDKLLLNILPAPIAERLKHDQSAIAENYDQVSILFADIVGFTPLASKLSPKQLVEMLNQIFSNFDELAAFLGLEKIKTIGDAYMVAAGLPVPREDHAEAIADMAIAMQAAINCFQTEARENFQIRVGINSGVVVAGVIGVNKFIYDLWGDTVNVASRMESSGEPGRIQVTEATYHLLKDNYVLEERGMVPVKGKGEMLTYWLKQRRGNEQ